jgi:hypothetical protein
MESKHEISLKGPQRSERALYFRHLANGDLYRMRTLTH